MRHQTPKAGAGGKTLFELWRDHPAGFKRYQETQKPNRSLFRDRKIWAGFVCPAPGETVFIGLFDASLMDTRKADWSCDYRGDSPNRGEPVDIFETRLRPELASHIGRMRVAWPKENARSWARKAEGLHLAITAREEQTLLPLAGAALMAELEALGFERRHTTNKLAQFRRGNLILYVKREAERLPLVGHPEFLNVASHLLAMDGVELAQPFRTYINSNLTQFPTYLGGDGKTFGRHGLAMGVRSNRLSDLISFLEDRAKIETPEGDVRVVAPADAPLTERERLQAARIGQGEFRNALMIYWNGACPVAGVDHGEVLRASHIKSWKESSNVERLDPFNGLLLCAHIDALFDRHLISFEDDGQMLISSTISAENRRRLGLEPRPRINRLHPRHLAYLANHRDRLKP